MFFSSLLFSSLLFSSLLFSSLLLSSLLFSLLFLLLPKFQSLLSSLFLADIDYGDDEFDLDYTPGFVGSDDWLYELLDENTACNPNPCQQGASCFSEGGSNFTCLCQEPYTGKKCQRVRNVCENVSCGHGYCVVDLKKPPFYECKCKTPYQGADCKSLPVSVCEPSPCKNWGVCINGTKRFRCACPDGYTGRFCEVAPTDCYQGDGASYRGSVSVTEGGIVCLDWHSYFILANGEDPFVTYSDFDGLGRNNDCRNPDGDDKPWCFTKENKTLLWDYCKIKKCSQDPVVPKPTAVAPQRSPTQFSQCGVSMPVRNSRIFGGRKSFPGAHPWQVSLQYRKKNSNDAFGHTCGGILISSCWVLTAAHCIDPNDEYQVVAGGVNLNKDETMDQVIPVLESIVHERYRLTAEALYNDVALLKLKVTDSPYCAKETRFVRTACLSTKAFPPGKECVISGWGKTENTVYSPQLLNARVLLISDKRCKAPGVHGDLIDASMICAGVMQGGVDTCQGDSGGPLVCEENGVSYVTGVVSWGVGCGEKNKPGVYANVHGLNNWIKSKMN
ncbi:factor VII-activating protease-like [Genypterus blacodes]|uniref:factor VII-activating protease-like n=1 Tax=Genypterus blacodes TaxID=154954 RepID=UPI003F770ED6